MADHDDKSVLEFPTGELPASDFPSTDTMVATEEEEVGPPPIRVLLLDDREENLVLRSAILRMHGYEAIACGSVADAERNLHRIDIAVLDYHLGAGKFGTEVAGNLRDLRPEVPIIILSATLERRFGGVEDMHLLKGHSSIEDLLAALRALEARRRGVPVVVDARDFFYSRILLAIGPDVLVQILDANGNWLHCNDLAAEYLGHPREWFPARNIFHEFPTIDNDWNDILRSVAQTRETYIDRTRRGLFFLANSASQNFTWSVLAFPITLHDGRPGAVLTARILDRNPTLFA